MQISKFYKFLLAAALLVVGLCPIIAQTETEEEAARAQAREQLNRKMAELEAQLNEAETPKPIVEGDAEAERIADALVEEAAAKAEAEAEATRIAAAKATQELAAQKAQEEARAEAEAKARLEAEANKQKEATRIAAEKLAQEQARQAQAFVTVPKVDDARLAEAREEMRRAISEARAATPTPTTVKPVVKQPTQTTTSKPGVTDVTATTVKPVVSDSARKEAEAKHLAAEQKAREAAARKQAEEQAMKAAAQKKALPALSAAALMDAPPAAVSVAKQQRLNEVLARYKADKLTPEQYHAERAKILAEP